MIGAFMATFLAAAANALAFFVVGVLAILLISASVYGAEKCSTWIRPKIHLVADRIGIDRHEAEFIATAAWMVGSVLAVLGFLIKIG